MQVSSKSTANRHRAGVISTDQQAMSLLLACTLYKKCRGETIRAPSSSQLRLYKTVVDALNRACSWARTENNEYQYQLSRVLPCTDVFKSVVTKVNREDEVKAFVIARGHYSYFLESVNLIWIELAKMSIKFPDLNILDQLHPRSVIVSVCDCQWFIHLWRECSFNNTYNHLLIIDPMSVCCSTVRTSQTHTRTN